MSPRRTACHLVQTFLVIPAPDFSIGKVGMALAGLALVIVRLTRLRLPLALLLVALFEARALSYRLSALWLPSSSPEPQRAPPLPSKSPTVRSPFADRILSVLESSHREKTRSPRVRLKRLETCRRPSGVSTGSLLALLGVENGDILESVNDLSPEKMFEAYARLRSAENVRVVVRRGDKLVRLDVAIR